MARKPFSGSAVRNQVEHGVGNLDIESCRVESSGDVAEGVDDDDMEIDSGHGGDSGRYPANVLFSTSAAVVLDAQSGTSVSTGGRAYQNTNDMYSGGWAEEDGKGDDPGYGDEGGASRYFATFNAEPEPLAPSIGGDILATKPEEVYGWFERLVTAEGQRVAYPFADDCTQT